MATDRTQKTHFELRVGRATVHVHQAFESWANPTIRINCDGEEKTFVIDKKGQILDIEINLQTMD